jgi:hypothetical protein
MNKETHKEKQQEQGKAGRINNYFQQERRSLASDIEQTTTKLDRRSMVWSEREGGRSRRAQRDRKGGGIGDQY